MNYIRLMPDFTASNIAVSVGEALAELNHREINAEQVQFNLLTEHSAYGEIIAQSPAPETFINPDHKIILDINVWGRRKIILADLLQSLSHRIQFDDSYAGASNQLWRLIVEMNASKPSSVDIGLKETLEQWFHSSGASESVLSFLRILVTTEPNEFLKAVKNANKETVQSFANILAHSGLARTLEPFFTDAIRKNLETEKSRFSFFQADVTRNFEKTLNPIKQEDWASFKSFLVHVYARLELKESLTHQDLLIFFTQKVIKPIIHDGFRQYMKSNKKNISFSHLHELPSGLESEIISNRLTAELASCADQPTSLWHMQALLTKYLKLTPNKIKLEIENDKAIFKVYRKKSKNDELWVQWIDYLFRPLSMQIDYTFSSSIKKTTSKTKPDNIAPLSFNPHNSTSVNSNHKDDLIVIYKWIKGKYKLILTLLCIILIGITFKTVFKNYSPNKKLGSSINRTYKQEYASYYTVKGVVNTDVLNIRKNPDHKSKRIGNIPYNGRCIKYHKRATSPNGKTWFKIEYGYTVGWVNSRYLSLAGGC